jgi:septation ring formation regulator EzrA
VASERERRGSAASADARIEEIRTHLKRYRDLSAQGKWAEAGKELEAVEAAVKK